MKSLSMKYKKLIDKFEVISFDVFDTLISRTTEYPQDIFYLAAEKIYNDKSLCINFKQKRIEAEHQARELSGSGEVTLRDIYNIIDIPGQDKEKFIKAEIQAELENCLPIEEMVSLFSYAVNEGKRVYIISDMYLPSGTISEMLMKCGVMIKNGQLYVSNEWGCNKISGKLFQIVLEQESIDPNTMIHFGDSIKADIFGAHSVGIHCHLTPRRNRLKRLIKRT